MLSFCKQLTAIILLVTILFAPFATIANDLHSVAMQEAPVCQKLSNDSPYDGSGRPVDCPCDGSGTCCENEECCHDFMELANAAELNVQPFPIQLVRTEPDRGLPKVYLAIFVPPEG